MKMEIGNKNELNYLFSFNFDLINDLEIYLKKNIKWQNEAIKSIINILKNNIVRTNKRPITMLFSWASWVGKSMTVRLLSKFLNEKVWWDDFTLYTIDMSKYYANETSSWFWSSPWFTWSNEWSLFEDISWLLYSKDNTFTSAVIYINELDKMKVNRDENALDIFFRTTMSLFYDNIHFFKSSKLQWVNIDLSNVIFILDWNFINDIPDNEFSTKIWFSDVEIEKELIKNHNEKNKKSKAKLINYLKKQIPISAFNRINYCEDSIIQFNDIWEDVIYDIFLMEYRDMIESMNNSKYKNIFNKYLFPTDEDYKKMLSTLDKNNWARWISNFVQYNLKNEIIKKVILPYNNYKSNLIKKRKILS